MSPAIEAVLTMCPPSPPAIIRGTNVSMPWITPQRLTPSTHCQSRCVARSSPPHAATPALLQRTWTTPNACQARSASAWTWPRSLTSVRTVSASMPCPRASPATAARPNAPSPPFAPARLRPLLAGRCEHDSIQPPRPPPVPPDRRKHPLDVSEIAPLDALDAHDAEARGGGNEHPLGEVHFRQG